MFLGLFLGAWFFGCTVTAYVFGIKQGKQMASNIVPSINPIKAIQIHNEKKENKVQDDLIAEGMANIMRYDGTSQMKEGE